jgi:amino-acid N-acetyltransferase
MNTTRTPAVTIARAHDEACDFAVDLVRRSGLPTDGLPDFCHTLLVARLEGRIIGTAGVELYEDGALLRSVAVEEDARGLGVGTRLTEAAVSLAGALGVDHIYLLTETASTFFHRHGFRPIERPAVPPGVLRSVEFTTACPADALVMVRKID